MEQHKSTLIIFGGFTRNFENELNGADPVEETSPEIFVCSLTKYSWMRAAIDSDTLFLAFRSVARVSESELLLYGGIDNRGKAK